jgi:hypothetical protein
MIVKSCSSRSPSICQQNERFLTNGFRAGYLIGDGAGVGKGRTVSGSIFENWLRDSKRALWIAVLKRFALRRRTRFTGYWSLYYFCKWLNALHEKNYSKISSDDNGVVFCTYSTLSVKLNYLGRVRTRFQQLFVWFGKDFDGVMIFDDCHRSKNLEAVGSGDSV